MQRILQLIRVVAVPWSQTIMPGVPRRAISVVSARDALPGDRPVRFLVPTIMLSVSPLPSIPDRSGIGREGIDCRTCD